MRSVGKRHSQSAFVLLGGFLLALIFIIPSSAQGFVYWANLGGGGTTVGRAADDGSGVEQGFVTGAAGACGVAAGATNLYWANSSSKSIGRANLDGSGVQQGFITGTQGFPCGVAVNSTHVYWATGGSGTTIGRANLDGNGVEGNLITGTAGPCGLAVDAAHVYWAHVSPSGIGRANLDGGGVENNFIAIPLGNPCGVAVDGSHVYWGGGNNAVGRANLDGSGVEQGFISTSSYVCGVAVDSAHVYWTRGSGTTVGRANLDGSGVNDSFITGATGPCGVAVTPPPPLPLPPQPLTAPTCTLKPKSSKVVKGAVELTATCDRTASVTLAGVITLKPKATRASASKKRAKAKKYPLKPVSGTAQAGVPIALKAKLPKKVTKAIAHGAKASASFTLSATAQGATAKTTAKIKRLKIGKPKKSNR